MRTSTCTNTITSRRNACSAYEQQFVSRWVRDKHYCINTNFPVQKHANRIFPVLLCQSDIEFGGFSDHGSEYHSQFKRSFRYYS